MNTLLKPIFGAGIVIALAAQPVLAKDKDKAPPPAPVAAPAPAAATGAVVQIGRAHV